MKIIFQLISILIIVFTGCYSEIPKPDVTHNNCIAIKIDSAIIQLPNIYFIDSNGIYFAAHSFDSDGYYYLFNVPPGSYEISYAHTYIPRDISVNKIDFEGMFYFEAEFIRLTKITINNNEFRFIGNFQIDVIVPKFDFGKAFDTMLTHSMYVEYKTKLLSYNTDKEKSEPFYKYLRRKFKDSGWESMIK